VEIGALCPAEPFQGTKERVFIVRLLCSFGIGHVDGGMKTSGIGIHAIR
jgi:hypothetical protein